MPWPAPGLPGIQTPRTSAAQTTSPLSLSPGDARSGTPCRRAPIRMVALRGRKMRTAKSPNGAPGQSPSSSHHLDLVYSSPRLSTPASHPTRVTYAPLYALPTIPSPFPPIRLHQSSALFVRARASTSPLSCPPLLQPAARVSHLLPLQSQPHAACCVPTAATSHHQFCLL